MAALVQSNRSSVWQLIVGLELHAQLIVRKKLFSPSFPKFGAPPNSAISPVDVGLPGALPVLQKECVDQAIRAGLGLNGTIQKVSRFERKHYFYCDMPTGYQITQQDFPIVRDGYLDVETENEDSLRVRIDRIQLEQDSAKSLHDIDPTSTYVDFNRAGMALVEVVTAPDMTTPEQASAFVRKLQSILKHLNVCDGIMAEGSLRCDVNISIRHPDWPVSNLGERVEVKNLNSLRSLEKAIRYEYNRQVGVVESGGHIERETRTFDAAKQTTQRLRSKEQILDYRFFFDPDLPPITLADEYIENVKSALPELPDAICKRYMKECYLEVYEARILADDPEVASFFETSCSVLTEKSPRSYKLCANLIINELFGLLAKDSTSFASLRLVPEQIASIINVCIDETASTKTAKKVLRAMYNDDDGDGSRNAEEIIRTRNWEQISDLKVLRDLCDQVLAKHPSEVEDVKRGKYRILEFLKAQVLKLTKGRGNPRIIDECLRDSIYK